MLTPISLDGDWTCETGGSLKSVDSLAAYQLDVLQNYPAGTWFRHVFVLDATDYCVSYVLQIDSIPTSTSIYINDERLSLDTANQFGIDITPYVSLGDNELAFHVEHNSTGSFEGVRLQPVLCD